MNRSPLFFLSFILIMGIVLFSSAALAQDPQLAPKRISSTGDSITEAINAELPNANHWASWVNGYHGFWEWLLGLTNVKSHNQRILSQFGRRGHKNFMEAVSGADSEDFAGQAQQAVDHAATYVTVLMGQNDVCGDDFADIPTDVEFESNMRAGFDILADGLPDGATIYVIGIVDIYELWVVAQDKQALGIVDCELLWALTLLDLYPCGTMLNPLIGDAGRLYTRNRNIAFNNILFNLTDEFNTDDSHHYWYYTDDVFDFGVPDESKVSDIDCFHPSAEGQRKLSKITWKAPDGPGF
jgi:lysophospholipase L1-like esterase